MHHVIADGWSMGLLQKEFKELYESILENRTVHLDSLILQYKDYAQWQREQLLTLEMKNHQAYWLHNFQGDLPILELPCFQARPKLKSYKGLTVFHNLDNHTTEALISMSQRQGNTLYMALIATVKLLLYKYSNQDELIIGSPVAGREHPDLEGQIGFYVNTLALRSKIKSGDSYTSFSNRVRETILQGFEHSSYPFDHLVQELGLERDASRNPLFDVMVVLQNASDSMLEFNLGEAKATEYEGSWQLSSKFDLLFDFVEHKGGLRLVLEYSTDLYTKVFAEQLIRHWVRIVEQVVSNPNILISEIEVLDAEEKAFQLFTLNQTAAYAPVDQTVVDLFEASVQKNPQAEAVIFEDIRLTYEELNAWSNRLARYLRKQAYLQPDDLIAIQLKRSEWMVIGLLGIIKSGAAYLPIEPDWPETRVQFMREDSGCKLLVNEEFIKEFKKQYLQFSEENLGITIRPEHLIYCLYTSGSTGQPKGVKIAHKHISGFILSNTSFFGLSSQNTFIATTNLVFDISVLELLGSLSNGLVLNLISNLYIENIEKALSSAENVILQFTPSVFKEFIGQKLKQYSSKISTIIIGGEAMDNELFKQLKLNFPNTKIINGYGPTETTIYSTALNLHDFEELSIGKPLMGESILILDSQRNLVPFGVAGELCIGGQGVSYGYQNNLELTHEKFIENPFSPGEMLYCTGDWGRWLPDNNIQYLGRMDDQVKIRGHRIELKEIELHLKAQQGVLDAVVAVKHFNDNQKELVAYYIGHSNFEDIRFSLTQKLPDYMVPDYFVRMEKFPLSSNGKLNKKELPLPTRLLIDPKQRVVPKTNLEFTLVRIWSEVLSVSAQSIGIEDDFFQIGGNSLKAIQVMAIINKEIDKSFVFRNLWEARTIRAFAKLITDSNGKDTNTIQFANSPTANHIFFIPPVSGIPNGLETFFQSLDNYNSWGFVYTRDIDFVEYCSNQIYSLTQNSTHISIIGHSAGGNIAHEVAKDLEKKGKKIDLLLMLDSYPWNFELLEKLPQLDATIDEINQSKELQEFNFYINKNLYLKEIADHYMKFWNKIYNRDRVSAHIVLIMTRSGFWQDTLFRWQKLTTGKYLILNGFGSHTSMLGQKYITKNVQILLKIFREYPGLSNSEMKMTAIRAVHYIFHTKIFLTIRKWRRMNKKKTIKSSL